MSLLLQEQYIGQLSLRLERFEKVGPIFKFRCPFCGDSEANKRKTRGYLYLNKKRSGYSFKCHNCNESHSFFGFLLKIAPQQAREFRLERIRESGYVVGQHQSNSTATTGKGKEFDLPDIEGHDLTDRALEWLRARKIPERHIQLLGFSDDFSNFIKNSFLVGTPKEKDYLDNRLPNDSRILIPYRTRTGTLFAVQGRAIDKEAKLRYITIRRTDDHMKIFGLDRMNKSGLVYVTEGPFDSMFLPNAIAIGGAGITDEFLVETQMVRQNLVLVYDNEPRNPQIYQAIENAIRLGVAVVIWKDGFTNQKDINDMIVKENKTEEEVLSFIQRNTYSGIRASFELARWQKVK